MTTWTPVLALGLLISLVWHAVMLLERKYLLDELNARAETGVVDEPTVELEPTDVVDTVWADVQTLLKGQTW